MADSKFIRSLVDKYQLEANGIKFWTPYFINIPKARGVVTGRNLSGPHIGKGSPPQIRQELDKILAINKPDEETAHGYRKLMFEHGLGIECSGFLYHVLDGLLAASYGRITDHLFWSRQELIDAFDQKTIWHKPELHKEVVEQYRDWVSMTQVVDDWGWEVPARMVNILRLVSGQTTSHFDDVRMLKPGDMIYQVGYDGIDHALLVVGVVENKITYAHSGGFDVGGGDPSYFGGVEYAEIEITDPALPIEQQNWERKKFLELHTFAPGALRRMKVLDGQTTG